MFLHSTAKLLTLYTVTYIVRLRLNSHLYKYLVIPDYPRSLLVDLKSHIKFGVDRASRPTFLGIVIWIFYKFGLKRQYNSDVTKTLVQRPRHKGSDQDTKWKSHYLHSQEICMVSLFRLLPVEYDSSVDVADSDVIHLLGQRRWFTQLQSGNVYHRLLTEVWPHTVVAFMRD